MKTRTRFAPSPTGFMHIGNLRTAIFEYLIAKRDSGSFILRIEDTDQERFVDGAIDFIYETLKLCNIDIDEGPDKPGEYGPYVQSERLNLYKTHAEELVEMEKAYYCFCDEKTLEEERKTAEEAKKAYLYSGHCLKLNSSEIKVKVKAGEKYVIRQKMPKEGESIFQDLVYGEIKVENKILEDQILIKSDGYPTYNFANVIDDHLMKITHVIRGNEYISSTPKYNLLYEAFGWDTPEYIHLPMVLGNDGTKLSKRNGDSSFMDLYNKGYLPEAIINHLVLLGWSPEDNTEIFSLAELIKVFNPKRLSKSPAIFDVNKLNWFNNHYLKQMEKYDFVNFIKPFLMSAYDLSNYDSEWINKLIGIYQEQLSYGEEIVELTSLFFNKKITLNEEYREFLNSDESIPNTLSIFKREIESINNWNIKNITDAINNTKEKSNVSGKLLFMPIRIKISGQMHGPELPETIFLLGKEIVLERLK